MADSDAEQAFFQAQAMEAQLNDPVASEDHTPDNDDDDEEYDPSKTLDDQYQLSSEPYQHEGINDTEDTEDVEADEADAIDPIPSEVETGAVDVASDPSQNSSRTESHSSSPAPPASVAVPQPRTIGGFLVEDDEDEEDQDEADYEPPAALEVDDTNAMPMSEDPSSGNAIQTSPDVSSHIAMQGVTSMPDVAHSSYSPVPVSNIDPAASAQASWTGAAFDASHQNSTVPTPVPDESAASRGRLPHDRVGILQDRVNEDPRGDLAAWLELIAEHRGRNRLDSAREIYERFLKVFPMAADQWVAYATMESELNELFRLEQIFNRTLLTIPSVNLWSVYLDYVRRRNPLTTDTSGQARRVISSAYDLALQYVGMDKDSGNIWTDYVEFIRSGQGTVGGSGWQDQQKMDLLRKAYQKAICVPTQAVNGLWKEYDQFEMGLNKLTGRKFLQEQSPSYMTARSSYTELQNFTRDLQVEIWNRWIEWEKADPLVLKEEDPAAFKGRVVYVYKQALMTLRFLPQVWFGAAEFCFQNDLENEGNEFLKQGLEANPESCLLAFKRADRFEVTSDSEQDSQKRATKVREPYDMLLDALYELITKAKARETQDVARIEETFARENPESQSTPNDDEDDGMPSEAKEKQAAKNAQVEAVRKAHSVQINLLSKTISFAWIALMRSMRRIQGKGKPGELAGSRQVFADARKKGRITSDVYIASALMEHHCYKDPAATKIFERGAKLFPEDGEFALEYLKHLIDINDIINARAVFETTVRRLISNPENVHKAKPIFAFFHEYESRYGDLVQVIHLENRMRELFPEDPALDQFSHRYATPSFDPTAVQPILSPTQTTPKTMQTSIPQEPRVDIPPPSSSPKRPYPSDGDYESDRPRKFVRAESPMKAAQSRRLEQQKRPQQLNGQMTSAYKPQGSPAPLPRDVVHLLSIIPHASAYNIARLNPEKMIDLIRRIDLPTSIDQIPLLANARNTGTAQVQNQYSARFIISLNLCA
ncbi:RNA-processing protein HAT helix [Penicillium malachiteum]|uniref:RNA-processing protein HAT helix n=1 Tax=Penicillium malachiteum TaxID=1324776 RepID=UPI0025493112|nr:RNA-processing protein HAT helix [Penicillium malachiteum]KAJ5721776.1 RNA-processing protein HAT helix [Penicillium malachiteum]